MMAHAFKSLVIACGLFAAYCSSFANGQEARIWTDKSGKHQIRAKLIDVVDGTVRLERPNGDISRIPLKNLSKDDQLLLRNGASSAQAQTARPPAPQGLQVGDKVEAEHFGNWQLATITEIDYKWDRVRVSIDGGDRIDWPARVEDLRYPGTNEQPILVKPPTPESALKTIRPNYDEMDRLVADGNPKNRVTADPQPLVEKNRKARAVRLTDGENFFESPSDFAITTNPQPTALIIHGIRGGHDDAFPRVEVVDLLKRKVVANGPAPRGTAKLAISPDGTRIATFPDGRFHSDDDTHVHIWKIAGTKIDHEIGFSPYVMDAGHNASAQWLAWLDDQRLFTVNGEGRLILWKADSAKAIYELEVERSAKPILSPGRKYLVVPGRNQIQFFDAAKGDLIAVVGSGNLWNASLAFSPSGRQLAISTSGFIDIIDVTSGETTRSFPCENTHGWGEMAWVDEDYLLTEGGVLINVPLRLNAWNFELNPEALVKSAGGGFWILAKNRMNKSQVLAPIELPPVEAVAAVKDLKEDELLAVRPGDAVSIDVQIPEDSFLAQDVAAALRAGLEEAGMKIAEDQKLKLVARMSHGETTQVNYQSFHGFRNEGQTMSVTARIYELELLLDGQVIWKRKAVHSAPHMLQMEKDESIESAVARVMKPTAANFSGRLPAYVVRPEFAESLGSSSLSPSF